MMKKILIAGCVLLLAAGCNAANDSSAVSVSASVPEETSKTDEKPTPTPETKPEETPAESEKPADKQEEAGVRTGVWASYEGDSLTRYFVFDNEMHGHDFDSTSGKSMDFRYEIDGDTIIFYMGEDENVVSAIFQKSDAEHMEVTWDYGSVETMEWVREYDENLTIYSSEDLCDLALDYYVRTNGSEPADYAYEDMDNTTVAVQLFDNVDGHNSTAAYYIIDRFTAEGTNQNSGEKINFAE